MQDNNNTAKIFLVSPWEKMDMLKTAPLGRMTFILSQDSLVVTRSVRGAYRIGGQLLSCPFLLSESFNPLGLLWTVVILVCCQIVVPSTSLLNIDLGRTHSNRVACMVALEICRE
jgi:hypothetical protein